MTYFPTEIFAFFNFLFHGIVITDIYLGITIKIIKYFASKTYFYYKKNMYTLLHYCQWSPFHYPCPTFRNQDFIDEDIVNRPKDWI